MIAGGVGARERARGGSAAPGNVRAMKPLEPMRFERHFVEKVWGGRSLERVPGIELPADVRIGETWEVVDREAENSVVATGAHRGAHAARAHARARRRDPRPCATGQGRTLPAARQVPRRLAGPLRAGASRRGGRGEARRRRRGEDGGLVHRRRGAGRRAVRRPARRSRARGVRARGPPTRASSSCSRAGRRVAATASWSAAGPCTRSGAGVTILEVQQNSDTTYRLYDWGRVGLDGKPRETHVEEALACVRFGAPAEGPRRGARAGPGGRHRPLEAGGVARLRDGPPPRTRPPRGAPRTAPFACMRSSADRGP